MLLRSYIVGKLSKGLLLTSFLIALFMVLIQLMQTAHLVLALPPKLSLTYLTLLTLYAYLIALGFSIFVAAASLLHTLREERFFHILYTFGIPARRVLWDLMVAITVIALAGTIASYWVNYQKISYFTKYLKFKFGEELLLTVPPGTFESFENLSVYFEKRNGRHFEHFLLKTCTNLATAREALLEEGGILKLKNSSVFSKINDYYLLTKSEEYTLTIVEPYSHKMNRKKLLGEFAFGAAVFLFALLTFPIFFALQMAKDWSRIQSYLIAFIFVIFQFAVALIVKNLVR